MHTATAVALRLQLIKAEAAPILLGVHFQHQRSARKDASGPYTASGTRSHVADKKLDASRFISGTSHTRADGASTSTTSSLRVRPVRVARRRRRTTHPQSRQLAGTSAVTGGPTGLTSLRLPRKSHLHLAHSLLWPASRPACAQKRASVHPTHRCIFPPSKWKLVNHPQWRHVARSSVAMAWSGRTARHLSYSRSPKNPALQLSQKSSKSASSTQQRPIWTTFGTVAEQEF